MKIKNSVAAVGIALAGFVFSAPLMAESNTLKGTGAGSRTATSTDASRAGSTTRPAEIPGTPAGVGAAGAGGASMAPGSASSNMGTTSSGSSGMGASASDPLVACKGMKGKSYSDCVRDHKGVERTTSSNATTKQPMNPNDPIRDRDPAPK